MNSWTEAGVMKTTVNHGLFMMSTHVAHDCVIGDLSSWQITHLLVACACWRLLFDRWFGGGSPPIRIGSLLLLAGCQCRKDVIPMVASMG